MSRSRKQPVELGPLGTYSNGKLNADDHGDLMLAVGCDKERQLVAINFNTQLSWLALDAESAQLFGEALVRAAQELRGDAQ